MTIEFVCNNCDKDVLIDLKEKKRRVQCQNCDKTYQIQLSPSMETGGYVDKCTICNHDHFYVQKDFNPRLGIFIFVLGVIFSYHTKFISLAVATLIDVILYKVLKTVTICYHCRAVYRAFKENPEHKGFDHELAMKLVVKEAKEQKEPAGDSL